MKNKEQLMKNKKILYVEDDVDTLELYTDFFKRQFREVVTASNGKEAFEKFINSKLDLVITDLRMGTSNGVELISAIRNIDTMTPILVLSAYTDEDFLVKSLKSKINGYLTKPADQKKLIETITTLLYDQKANNSLEEQQVTKSVKNESTTSETSSESMLVVGIGASAGGLEALRLLVSGLPEENNTSYIVAQHLSPTHKTMLVDLLSRETNIPIKDAEHGETLQANVIYITPPNKNIKLGNKNTILLSEPEKHSFLPKPSVNELLISIANQKKEKGVGIILSGTGSDGAQGMRAINVEGGITIVQEPQSAKYNGMPVSSINDCSIDIIMEPAQIGEELLALSNFPREKVLKKHLITQPNDEMSEIYHLLHQYKKVDFSVYKKATITRRIERRMVALKVTVLSEYITILKKDTKEVEALYKDILIGVTSFFRDPEAYEALKKGLHEYLDKHIDTQPLRIWTPGASTGEEAYSILITIQEILTQRQQSLNIRMFATDIDEDALKVARRGIYSNSTMGDLNESVIKKYFKIKDDEFEVNKSLRDLVVFSFHNLLADPPFKDLDLVVCRNLLIYFNTDAQKYIMPSFHYGLKAGATLFLGKSENITNFENFFSSIDKGNKLFKAIPAVNKDYVPPSFNPSYKFKSKEQQEQQEQLAKSETPLHEQIIQEAAKLLFSNVIVTNEQMEVMYKKGELDFLNVPEGYVTYNIFKMISPALAMDMRTLVSKAKNDHELVSSLFIPYSKDDKGNISLIRIHLIPIINKRSQVYIFYFQKLTQEDLPLLTVGEMPAQGDVNQILELELQRTKEHLQTLIEELVTTNEELQSSNEELQSTNEELQSTNEELETSNEELQSTNEELQTAYSELTEVLNTSNNMKDEIGVLNERYETLLENIHDAVVVTNVDGIFVRVNNSMQTITGMRQEQLLVSSWQDIVVNTESLPLKERKDDLMNGKPYGPYELNIFNVNGEEKTLLINDYAVPDGKGLVQVWSFAKDISEQKAVLSELTLSEQTYKMTFEQANVGIAHIGLDGSWMNVNQRLLTMLNYSETELKSMTFKDITFEDDLEPDVEMVQELLDGKRDTYSLEKRYYKKDRTILWANLSVAIVRDKNEDPMFFISIIQDINQVKTFLQDSQQARVVFESTQEAIMVTDSETKIISVNPAFEQILGYPVKETIGKYASILKSNQHTSQFYDEMWRAIKQTGYWSGEIINKNVHGENIPTYLNINAVYDEQENVIQYIGVLTDISLVKKSQEKIKHLANHDMLTQLPNRAFFKDRIAHALEQARRNEGSSMAVLFIDLDRFKIINDGLGHIAGDKVLIEVAKRIKSTVRLEDTVARLGGDEFVVLLEHLDSPLDASKVAQNIIETIGIAIEYEEQNLTVGASIGISIYPNDGLTSDELTRQADIAMYAAKEAGRNTFRYISEELSTDAFEKVTMEHAIRGALNNKEFSIYYQPIIDLQTNKLSHFEALIRWNHPKLGLVLPGKFIPLAEESELIVDISEYLSYEVLSTLKLLQEKQGCNCKIAINLSLKDFKSDSFYYHLKQHLQQLKVDPKSLIIEVTERKFMLNDSDDGNLLKRYEHLGVNFAMDDFGTGYSNLGYLVKMPFDFLKIDRSFISKIGLDEKSEEVIKATIAIAKALNITTIGEGVETLNQLKFLQQEGCEFAQGFYIQTPKPMDKFQNLIDSNKTIPFEK
mgnify:CR=1 FL=1